MKSWAAFFPKKVPFLYILWKAVVFFKLGPVCCTLKPATLLKVTFLHRCFSRFFNCTNGTKSRKVLHILPLLHCFKKVFFIVLKYCKISGGTKYQFLGKFCKHTKWMIPNKMEHQYGEFATRFWFSWFKWKILDFTRNLLMNLWVCTAVSQCLILMFYSIQDWVIAIPRNFLEIFADFVADFYDSHFSLLCRNSCWILL